MLRPRTTVMPRPSSISSGLDPHDALPAGVHHQADLHHGGLLRQLCGNRIQYITIEDTTAPEFDAFPADVTVECDAVPAVADLGSLLAPTSVTLQWTSAMWKSEPMGPVRTYTLTRTWEVEDCASNTTDQSQTIEIQDTTEPMLTIECPADILYENVPFAQADLSIATNGAPSWTATDNCDSDVAVAYTYEDEAIALDDSDGSNRGRLYDLVRTFTVTATDGAAESDRPELSADPHLHG